MVWPREALIAQFVPESGIQNKSTEGLFTRVTSTKDLDTKLSQANAASRPVILDYYADWCVDCIRMEKTTLTDPTVRQVLRDFVMVQVDVTDPRNPSTNAIKKRYGVYGPPAMLFFDRAGNELSELRRYGYMDPEEFIAHINQIDNRPLVSNP